MIGKIKKIGGDLLFHAINHANVHDVIALLEENEVDVNCQNINGQTPLHVSLASNKRDKTIKASDQFTDITVISIVCCAS